MRISVLIKTAFILKWGDMSHRDTTICLLVLHSHVHAMHVPLTLDELSALCSFCSRRVAALTSSFLAAMCSAGSRTLPRESFSRSTATTRSCPCCRATASGVKPSYKGQWEGEHMMAQLICHSVQYDIADMAQLLHNSAKHSMSN